MYLGLKEVTSAHIITYQDLRKYLKEFQKGDYDAISSWRKSKIQLDLG
jgi:hypothetical protein